MIPESLQFDPTEHVAVLIVIAVFVLQLIFCSKANRVFFKLLPTIITFISAAGCFIMIYISNGWDAVGYLFLAIFAAFCFAVCLLAWLLWGIFRRR